MNGDKTVKVSLSYIAIMFDTKMSFVSAQFSDAAAAVSNGRRPSWFLVLAHSFMNGFNVCILNNDNGRSIEVSEEQPLKTSSPRNVTESGIVMVVREEQPLKTPRPRDVTESGIVIVVREEQPQKTQ